VVLKDFPVRNFDFHPDEAAVRVFITEPSRGRFAFNCDIAAPVGASNG
jgi:hypothetical protein